MLPGPTATWHPEKEYRDIWVLNYVNGPCLPVCTSLTKK